MTIEKRINGFVILGEFLGQFATKNNKQLANPLNEKFYSNFEELIGSAKSFNGWFTEENVRTALSELAKGLERESFTKWVYAYPEIEQKANEPKKVAVIMAGNIPLVGFHDMLCVLMSGNIFLGKLSADDKLLLPVISKILVAIEPEFDGYIKFTEAKLEGIEAVIATGSNNTARYFDYYFGKYPSIIRKNRNSVAVITGNEEPEELTKLGKDIFQYFGLGCRNVSKLFVPRGYQFDKFYEAIYFYNPVINNNKYGNNYDYNRTVYLMSKHPSLLDNNFLLLKEDEHYSSPIGVLFFEYYDEEEQLIQKIERDGEQIQCVVSNSKLLKNAVPFGEAQCPTLNDYADGIDTMRFLLDLSLKFS